MTVQNEQPPEFLQYLNRRLSQSDPGVGEAHSITELPPTPTRSILSEATLQEIRNKLSAAEFRRVELAQCVFDTSLTAMFFGRGLLDIYNAAMHSPCEEDADDFGGHTLDQTSACIVSVSGMITTFDFVGALIALLVSECPEGANIKALCASDCTILVGAVSGLLQVGTSMLLVCGKTDEHIDHILEDVQSDIVP